MSNLKVRSAVTLAVLGVVLVVMLVVGWKSTTASFPSLTSDSKAAACQDVQVKKVIFRREITVSVYNASKKAGFADATMGSMERRNFQVGAIGNAPDGITVPTGVEVHTTVADDPRATLVAQQYRPLAKIVVDDEEIGPGIDIILGPNAGRPIVPAPKSLKLAKPVTTCLDKATANPTTGS